MNIFRKEEYYINEVISCDCGNDIFRVIKYLTSGTVRWDNYLELLNGHNFKPGQLDCRCNKCDRTLDFRLNKDVGLGVIKHKVYNNL